jgi:hypothetical protein
MIVTNEATGYRFASNSCPFNYLYCFTVSPTVPTSLEAALCQFSRLIFDRNGYKPSGYVAAEAGSLPRLERLFRILISWILLVISKIVAITTPLFFQSLVEKATEADKSFNSDVSTQLVIQSAAFGLILGYCISRVASGVVQLISEFVLFPATSSVARILPVEAFSAALQSAYKRGEESSSKRKHSNGELIQSEKGTASYSRILDRGLKASNHFLYRSIFNLLPAYILGRHLSV